MTDVHYRPGAVALKAYRNKEYGYSFVFPETWHQFDLQIENGQGVLFSPSLDDLSTHLSVEVTDIGMAVSAEDISALREGFLAGLRKVRGSTIEAQEDYDVGFLIGLEARQTYRDGKARRKRWIRLLYWGTRQVRLIAQGATVDDFEYWLPVFDPAMTTFIFGEVWPEPVNGAPSTDQDWLHSLLDPSSGQQIVSSEDEPK